MRRSVWAWVCGLLACTAGAAAAAEVRGWVVHGETGRPLAGVEVRVLGMEAGAPPAEVVARTDARGGFRVGRPMQRRTVVVQATYRGVVYTSGPHRPRDDLVLTLRVFETTQDPRGLYVARRATLLELAPAGLVVRSGTTSCRDAFGAAGGGYIVLPVTRTGRVVDLQGRAFPDAQGRPKYLNLPGERRYLYGEDNLAGPWVLLCEGILDAMSAELAGLPACAVFGTNGLKEQHLAKFRRCSRIYVCFDRDATQKAATAACMFGTRGRVVILPDSFGEHGDLNDMLVAADNPAMLASTLHALMKRAPTGYEVRIDTLQCDDPYELYGAAAGLLAEIHRLDPISRGLLLKKLADRTGLPASLVEQAAREAAAHEAEVQKAAAAAAAT